MKIVVNKCYGGFAVSQKVCDALGMECVYDTQIERTDPRLVELVETLGDEASGRYARLCVVNIPDDVTDWELEDYDGAESIIYVLNGKIGRA